MDSKSLEDLRDQSAKLAAHLRHAISDIFEDGVKQYPNRVRSLLFSIQAHAKTLAEISGSADATSDQLSTERAVIDTRAIELEMALIKDNLSPSDSETLTKLISIARSGDAQKANRNISDRGAMSSAEVLRWQTLFRDNSASIKKMSEEIREIEAKQSQAMRRLLETSKLAQKTEGAIRENRELLDEATRQAIATGAEIVKGLQAKEREANKLVGLVSGAAIAGSYERSAVSEMKWADATRNGSVLLMLLIVLIIGYSLFETAKPNFDLQTSLLRLLFSLALSVPAAYLARESTKHRIQQYAYRRMSLDLQAITPYLASLPDSEQHRLKAEMASRLFGGRDADHHRTESYPVNIHELVMALVSRANESNASPNSQKKAT